MEETINGYTLLEPFQNRDAGFSRWTFAVKNGRDYFIKEFLDPVYPQDDAKIGTAQMDARRRACREFEYKKKHIYSAINLASDGNVVRVAEFFRKKSRYYVAMERIYAVPMEIVKIAQLPMEIRMQLCRVIAHSMAGLHAAHIVHADIKDKNILIRETPMKTLTAKIIDMDLSFFESLPPQDEGELGGDQIYLSPEACLFLNEEEASLTTKMDVFSLGILFHQYLTGYVPWYDNTKYDYLHESVLDGNCAPVSDSVPVEWRTVMERMLLRDPEKRCSMEEVCNCILPSRITGIVNINAVGNGFSYAGDIGAV